MFKGIESIREKTFLKRSDKELAQRRKELRDRISELEKRWKAIAPDLLTVSPVKLPRYAGLNLAKLAAMSYKIDFSQKRLQALNSIAIQRGRRAKLQTERQEEKWDMALPVGKQ